MNRFFIFLLLSYINYVLSAENKTCFYGFSGSQCDECGRQFVNPNTKIVGGVEALKNSWPSIAFLVFRYEFDYDIPNVGSFTKKVLSYCGGSLIDRETILTAAHCFVSEVKVNHNGVTYTFPVLPNTVFSSIESMYTIYLGLHSNQEALNELDLPPGAISGRVKEFIMHPDYDKNSELNDIALIKLESPVVLNRNIQIACLPNPELLNYPTRTNIDAWAAGWGNLGEDGPSADKLYNVRMTLYDKSQCANVATDAPKNWNTQICAGEILGGKDTCQGDSGGPLYVRDLVNGRPKYVLVGVTSYGVGCARPGLPGIYTKISSYLDWINQFSQGSNVKKINKA